MIHDARHLMAIAALGLSLAQLGCDQVRTREIETSRASLSSKIWPMTISSRGLKRVLERRLKQDGGLALATQTQASQAITSASLGPISQRARVDQIELTQADESLNAVLSTRDLLVVVPVRVSSDQGVELCRWQLLAKEASLSSSWRAKASEPGRLEAPTMPQAQLTQQQLSPIGACASLSHVSAEARAALEAEIIIYGRRAVAQAAQTLLNVELAQELGLLTNGLEVTHQNNFPTRRGQLELAHEISRAATPTFDEQAALKLHMDHGVQITLPASCAPLSVLPELRIPALEPPQAAEDVALAIPIASAERLLHMASKAGFLCRGLDALGTPQAASIELQDVLLDALGIPTERLGASVYINLSAGGLPTLEPDTTNGTIIVNWPGLTVQLYGVLDGALAQLLEVTTLARFHVRPALSSTAGQIDFNVETMEAEEIKLRSDWITGATNGAPDLSADAQRSWTRRFLLLALGQKVSAPLPLKPTSALKLKAATIRDQALVLQLELDTTIPLTLDDITELP